VRVASSPASFKDRIERRLDAARAPTRGLSIAWAVVCADFKTVREKNSKILILLVEPCGG